LQGGEKKTIDLKSEMSFISVLLARYGVELQIITGTFFKSLLKKKSELQILLSVPCSAGRVLKVEKRRIKE